MEFTVYPVSLAHLGSKTIDVDRMDLKDSNDTDFGDLMLEIPLNNYKGSITLYLSRNEALMLAKNIELFLALPKEY